MGSIYRFEKIEFFRQLIQEKALTFVLPQLWDDKREGFLFRAVQSEQGTAKVLEALKKIAPSAKDLSPNIALLRAFRYSRYAQCWSRCSENGALWKGYQVRLEVERDDISKLDGIKAYDVRYVDSIKLEDELKSLFTHQDEKTLTWESENILLTKRIEFSYEQEVRLLTEVVIENTVDMKPPSMTLAMAVVLQREYQQGKITKDQFERCLNSIPISMIKKVSIAHVPNFIRSVMLNPFEPPAIDEEMARFCAQNSLNYLGKSKMYEFNL